MLVIQHFLTVSNDFKVSLFIFFIPICYCVILQEKNTSILSDWFPSPLKLQTEKDVPKIFFTFFKVIYEICRWWKCAHTFFFSQHARSDMLTHVDKLHTDHQKLLKSTQINVSPVQRLCQWTSILCLCLLSSVVEVPLIAGKTIFLLAIKTLLPKILFNRSTCMCYKENYKNESTCNTST